MERLHKPCDTAKDSTRGRTSRYGFSSTVLSTVSDSASCFADIPPPPPNPSLREKQAAKTTNLVIMALAIGFSIRPQIKRASARVRMDDNMHAGLGCKNGVG